LVIFFKNKICIEVGAPNSGVEKDENFPKLDALFISKHLRTFQSSCYQQLCFRPSLKRVAALNTKAEESKETSVTVHQYTQNYISEGFNHNSLGCLKFYNKILRNGQAVIILFLEQENNNNNNNNNYNSK
jgi:hypothetical protein